MPWWFKPVEILLKCWESPCFCRVLCHEITNSKHTLDEWNIPYIPFKSFTSYLKPNASSHHCKGENILSNPSVPFIMLCTSIRSHLLPQPSPLQGKQCKTYPRKGISMFYYLLLFIWLTIWAFGHLAAFVCVQIHLPPSFTLNVTTTFTELLHVVKQQTQSSSQIKGYQDKWQKSVWGIKLWGRSKVKVVVGQWNLRREFEIFYP